MRKALQGFGLKIEDTLVLEQPAAQGSLAKGEALYVLPARDLRTLLQRAVDEQREVVVLYLNQGDYRRQPFIEKLRVRPHAVARSGSRYDLMATDAEEGAKRTLAIHCIQAVRLVEPGE